MDKIDQVSSTAIISIEPINKCITAINTLAYDYISEEGTSGNWTYRKWASGLAECWGTFQSTSLVTNDASVFSNFPFVFSSAPMVQVSGQANSSQNSYLMYANAGVSAFDAWIHSNDGSDNFTAFVYASGTI